LLFFYSSLPTPNLHSFPTRRSSDLIVIGLLIAALGALAFYPAAKVPSYPLFLLALFVLATGITLLQVAANPYISLLGEPRGASRDRKSTRLNSSHVAISYAVFCLKK